MQSGPEDSRADEPEVSLLINLRGAEQWWAARYEFLKEQGYMLRPRYRPGWKASFTEVLDAFDCEDGQSLKYPQIMDAIRISDSTMVAIKRVDNPLVEGKRTISTEERMMTLFSSDEHASNPQNHSIPLLQALHIPEIEAESLLVMPWMRSPVSPHFRSVGEGLQFIKEIFEGVQYLHQNHVAHRDCSLNNMVMDARTMYPDGFHPSKPSRSYDWKTRAKHFSRTRCPPRYYLIDYGFSRIYDPSKPRPLTYGIRSGGIEPPETKKPCDPFATDVYLLGMTVRLDILDGRGDWENPGIRGFEFLRPLVNDMTQDDPSQRPNMDEVLSRFSEVVHSLSSFQLRSRVPKKDDNPLVTPFRAVSHLIWTCDMLLKRRPAIPLSR